MTCDQTQPLLEAFADDDLGWGTARRVRRHLAGCPKCAAELAEILRLDARVRAWRDVVAPAGLQSRVSAALASASSAPVSRRPVLVRRAAVGLTGLAASLVAFFWIVPGQLGHPTIAFADVEKAMQQVQTVTWRTEVQADSGSSSKPNGFKMAYTNWLRRDPPAIAMTDYDASAPYQGLPMHNPIKDLVDDRGGFILYKDECDLLPTLKESAQQRVDSQLRGFTEMTQVTPFIAEGEQAQPKMTNFRQQSVTVDGQRQVRFDRDFRTVLGNSQTVRLSIHMTDWVDSKTRRLARVEMHVSKDPHERQQTMTVFRLLVMDHFQYDQAPPKGVFDWSPPAGVRVVRH